MNINKSLNLKYNELYDFPNYIFQDFKVISNSKNSYKPELIKIPVSKLPEAGIFLIWYNGQKTKYDFHFMDNNFTLENATDLKLQDFKVGNKPDNIITVDIDIVDIEHQNITHKTTTQTVIINGKSVEVSNEVEVINTDTIKTLVISKQLEKFDQTTTGRIQLVAN